MPNSRGVPRAHGASADEVSVPALLGMPAMPPPTDLPTFKRAWDTALYGVEGFFRREAPADHFRTSVHASPLLAEALLRLCDESGLDTVVDIGAGRGELLGQLRELDGSRRLVGIEVAERPEGLHGAVEWAARPPETLEGLVVAHEWLDNVPCHVVEVDADGVPRVVHVDPVTGEEALGSALGDPGVPRGLAAWCDRWWPMEGAPEGSRAEVGTTRDRAWADVVRRVRRGVAVAVDYGHVRDDRPAGGSLASYLRGRQARVVPDGSRDVTAHVAVDAVAAAVGGTVLRQADALRRLGVSGSRPDLALAGSDPAAYVSALARASQAGELTEAGGLGDHYWVVTSVGTGASVGASVGMASPWGSSDLPSSEGPR